MSIDARPADVPPSPESRASPGVAADWRSAIRIAATAVAVVNVGLFAWVTVVLAKETAAATPIDAAPPR